MNGLQVAPKLQGVRGSEQREQEVGVVCWIKRPGRAMVMGADSEAGRQPRHRQARLLEKSLQHIWTQKSPRTPTAAVLEGVSRVLLGEEVVRNRTH